MQLPSAFFSPNPQNFSRKSFLYFFLKKTRSEKISYILSKESFSYISGNGTLHFPAQPSKFFLKKRLWKFFYISENRA